MDSPAHPPPPNRSLPAFPGGTSLSHLSVYDWDAADGCAGGTPHLHTVSTEAYVVTGGSGEVHTISAEGPRQDPLEAGTLLWFTPGTVHRLVNHGDLQLNVIMSNAGLPEAGDAVMLFPDEILADPEAYRRAATLPGEETARAEAARRRRDLAIVGYGELLAAVEAHGPSALERVYARAVDLVRPKTSDWERIFAANVEESVARTRTQLDALARGNGSHLGQATVIRGNPRPGPKLWGMCGRLQTWTGDQVPDGDPTP
ncbi:cupin domain-containing protein [Zhihengliuella flava]|uniref:Mannose-6-phosphate isomerase-like protein (Cupin superfamily) n=1 Tax=Zhihengliuella flava TaxID=1285193 RepID=A0A931GLH9_9MICC|nr:cupin domain-containing protein [Zhihengliuella flava]MBG6084469.1 mannose-6-phosphate isomerase-like protein (cupin superfamily) [Zhihengliuella flava]